MWLGVSLRGWIEELRVMSLNGRDGSCIVVNMSQLELLAYTNK